MRIALINTNRMKPPIGPIGLEYAAEALRAQKHRPAILDLCWERDWKRAIALFFDKEEFDLIGFTLRNTDDCAYTSRQSFIGEFVQMVRAARNKSDAEIILGGVGFSSMPEPILDACGADAGVFGDGDLTIVEVVKKMEKGLDWHDTGGLIWRKGETWHRNRPIESKNLRLPTMTRAMVDNFRYFREGGQAGFETKRGCPGVCTYCCEPVAKGRTLRLRPAGAVVDELENLLTQKIDHLHTCDSEFNIPEWHAIHVCEEITRRGLGTRLRWYAYCTPKPFSKKLARVMKNAGCVGINFGVDSGDEKMLSRLRRNFTPDDILHTTRLCKEQGLVVMLDLLLGSPGENPSTLKKTVALMKESGADRIGLSVGVRVYPGTELSRTVLNKNLRSGLIGGENPDQPLFFLEPGVKDEIFELLDRQIGNDERFFFFDPNSPERNYNYNDNVRLIDAILQGYRGAYWDILRKYSPSNGMHGSAAHTDPGGAFFA
jgi:hypothetical protein